MWWEKFPRKIEVPDFYSDEPTRKVEVKPEVKAEPKRTLEKVGAPEECYTCARRIPPHEPCFRSAIGVYVCGPCAILNGFVEA